MCARTGTGLPRETVTLDANVLIALTDQDDPHYDDAAWFIRRSIFRRTLLIHPLNVAEAAIRPSAAGVVDQVRRIWDFLGVHVTKFDDEQPWRLASLRASTGLGLPDCCVLDTARQTASAVATFDVRLARQAEQLGVDLAL